MKSGIYTIENLVNGKLYVGYATNLKARKNKHWSRLNIGTHVNSHLQNAWNECGEESFKFEELVQCPIDQLCSEENYWCNLLDTHNRDRGYNILPTGPNGRTAVSQETRDKISRSTMGIKKKKWKRSKTEEERAVVREFMKNKKNSPETIEKMKIAAKKRGFPEAARIAKEKAHAEGRRGGSKKGATVPEERKKRISETLKAKTKNQNYANSSK